MGFGRDEIMLEFYEQALLGRRDDRSPESLIMAYVDRQREMMRTVHNPRNNFKRKVRLAKARKLVVAERGPCGGCGETVRSANARARFCNRSCRNKAARAERNARMTPDEKAARKAAQYERQARTLKATWAKRQALPQQSAGSKADP